MTMAVIGGSGVYNPSWMSDAVQEVVTTPFGDVEVTRGLAQGNSEAAVFINRHGRGHRLPPHRVNYRANIWALKQLKVQRIIATAAVGSLNPSMAPGALVLPDQFIDFTRSRPSTFFEGGDSQSGVVHADMSQPFCPALADLLVQSAELAEVVPTVRGATYVCSEGPRFETPAEIRAFQMLGGDLVGMTAVPEAVLARELGMCYQTVALVTNWAAGLSDHPLSQQEVFDLMAERSADLARLMEMTVVSPTIAAEGCSCAAQAGMDD
jgi:5'-methylthioadenosine phosphorylase